MAGSIRSLRSPRSRDRVRSSSEPASRLYPTTSAASIAASFRVSAMTAPQPQARLAQRQGSKPTHLTIERCLLVAPRVTCRDAAIRSLSGEKRTSRGRRKSVVRDPQRHFAARLRCNAAWTACGYHHQRLRPIRRNSAQSQVKS